MAFFMRGNNDTENARASKEACADNAVSAISSGRKFLQWGKELGRRIWRHKIYYLMLLPAIVLLAIFAY